MPKRKPTSRKTAESSAKAASELRRTLARMTPGQLADLVLELARADSAVMRQLIARFGIQTGPEELVAATRRAISDATEFDSREMNTNFDYDHRAYRTVKANFIELIRSNRLPTAMELAIELMKRGSRQIEMSDEGMMTDDVEECIAVVVQAIKKSTLSAAEVAKWRRAMQAGDSVGFVADDLLDSLQAEVGDEVGDEDEDEDDA